MSDIDDILDASEQRSVTKEKNSRKKRKPKPGVGGDISTNTIFVRNLPFSTKAEHLETLFSDIGPLKQCFVVTDKKTRKCRGFGYVRFAMPEDAKTAVESLDNHTFKGREIKICMARRRLQDEEEEDSRQTAESSQPANETIVEEKPNKKKRNADESKPPSIEKGVEKKPEQKRQKGVSKPNEDNDDDDSKPDNDEDKAVKKKKTKNHKARLVVRNLPFIIKEPKLEKMAKKFGDLLEVRLVRDGRGRSKGYGFVEFENTRDAARALAELNMKTIKGRKIAVDWCLAKEKYKTMLEQMDEESSSSSDEESDSDQSQSEDEGEDVKTVDEDDEDEDDADGDASAASSTDEDDSDDEEEDEENNSNSKHDVGDDENDDNMSTSSDDEDENMDDDDNDDDAEDEEEKEDQSDKTKRQGKSSKSSDVSEGKTLFVRNVPYESTKENLKEFFSEFGQVEFALPVKDKMTGLNRGTAFVKFKSKEDADSCLLTSESDPDSMTLSGKRLYPSIALDRDEASKVKKEAAAQPKPDKRNLFLIREGFVATNTEEFESLSQGDKRKRLNLEKESNEKKKNPNYFISKTRLSVHNIPVHVEDKELKQIFRKAAGQGGVIKQCKLVRDPHRINPDGKPRSKGFGFVEFFSHDAALAALKKLNNNPKFFKPEKRLIIQFAWEDVQAIRKREEKMKRQKTRGQQLKAYLDTMPKQTEQGGQDNKTKGKGKQKKQQKRKADDNHDASGPSPSNRTDKEQKPNQNQGKKKRKIKGNKHENGEETKSLSNPAKRQQQPKTGKQKATQQQTKAQQSKPQPKQTQPKKPTKRNQDEPRLSRKQRKKEYQQETKFDDMVSKYRSKLSSWSV